jgi:bifunctional non-homologous end joining protein LigD
MGSCRMHGRAAQPGKENWLLIKEKDAFARSETDPAITDRELKSAITKRSMDQIAKSEDHVWNSSAEKRDAAKKNGTIPDRTPLAPARKPRTSIKKVRRPNIDSSRLLQSAPQERFPGFIEPQLAQQATTAPDEADWIHELKLDGYRIQIHIRSSKRNGR